MHIDKYNLPYILKFDYKALKPQLIRPMIEQVRKENWKNIIGVEIGVYKGFNSASIMRNLDMKRLYLVDPYISYDEYTEVDMDNIKQEMKRNLHNYSNRLFINKTSKDAINHIPDNLDFVYIDGNHTYEYVKQDIELYYPKVKQGGYIGGHDYPREGLVDAVTEFCEKENKKLFHKRIDWWVKI